MMQDTSLILPRPKEGDVKALQLAVGKGLEAPKVRTNSREKSERW